MSADSTLPTGSPWVGVPAIQIAASVRSGEVTAVEVIEAHLAHIQQVDPHLHAFINVAAPEVALARAADLDRRREAGETLGALAGVPVSVKDLIAVAGMPWTAGSRVLRDHLAMADAPAVARILAADAIIIGKTNTPEFGLSWLTDNELMGPTTSPVPFPQPLSPGGSSGGEAAALASGMSALGLGTDFGGSVRWPAHCTGLASVRPTPGRVSPDGQLPGVNTAAGWLQSHITPHGAMQQIGPMGRTVSDVELGLRLMSSPWTQLPATDTVDLHTLTVGWATSEGTIAVEELIRDAVEAAAHHLGTHGATVAPFDTEDLAQAHALFGIIRATEQHTEILGLGPAGGFGAVIRNLLQAREPVAMEQVERLWQQREQLRGRILAAMPDVLLMPVAAVLAPPLGETSFQVGDSTVANWDVLAPARAISLLGFPVVTVPTGTAPDGRPIGIQVIARPWHEHHALAAATVLEARGKIGGATATQSA